jgi:hypothetical protein
LRKSQRHENQAATRPRDEVAARVISALKMVDRGDRRYGGLHVVRKLIVLVDNHKADTTEEQNAV